MMNAMLCDGRLIIAEGLLWLHHDGQLDVNHHTRVDGVGALFDVLQRQLHETLHARDPCRGTHQRA